MAFRDVKLAGYHSSLKASQRLTTDTGTSLVPEPARARTGPAFFSPFVLSQAGSLARSRAGFTGVGDP